ncbi:MAG: hypothetical protein ACLUEQ_03025 [Cloacibacillus evryensis]
MKKLNFPGVRLGGTSWVVEGSFADNLRELSREARDMQFVLFDNKYGVNIPSKEEVNWLAALKNELGMSCTVHFRTTSASRQNRRSASAVKTPACV